MGAANGMEHQGVRPDIWLLLGPRQHNLGYPAEDVAAFRDAFGPEAVVMYDHLVAGVHGGRLVLRDLEGCRAHVPPATGRGLGVMAGSGPPA
ncbi:hypothetical protein [Streptomyces sp. NPDC060022]|uniref:hypothetical protein n=1 Tax=Streptomyces sp. NPDC060022 TaxID=3347039 RepID=UPI00367A696C